MEAVGRRAEAVTAPLRQVEQVEVRVDVVEQGSQKSGEPLRRRCTRSQRRRPLHGRELECALAFVEQCERQAGLVPEPAVERALADAGLPRHVVHADLLDSSLCEEPSGGLEDALAVAGRVGALHGGGTVADERQLPA